MELNKIKNLSNDIDRVKAIYKYFDETSRFNDKATMVEFITTVSYIEKYLDAGMRILDIGAGSGAYSFYFAEKGYDVSAVELVKKHVELMENKKSESPHLPIRIFEGNAIDLIMLDTEVFDIVLCLGPLYHLRDNNDKQKCIKQIIKHSRSSSKIFFSFISNDMVICTERMCYNKDFLLSDNYDHSTFKVHDFPFVFHTVDACREILSASGMKIIEEIAVDGLSELLADQINNMSDEDYNQWLKYHFYYCNKPEFFGASNHLIFICQN